MSLVSLIKINGKIYHLVRKEYDPLINGYYYFVQERNEPFCDLDDEIEEVYNG